MFESGIPENRQAPDFSIVTVCLNSESTIRDTVDSVCNQRDATVEHIIKDGGSRDATLQIARSANAEALIVERGDNGVYDAMNQGFQEASGRIVAFLNSDDYYLHDRVLATVRGVFLETSCDIAFGDIRMIDEAGRIRRKWRGRDLKPGTLGGMQLPHPAVFVRRGLLDRLNPPLDPSYNYAADLKQQLILVEKYGCKVTYIAKELTCMRLGGESTGSLRGVVSGWQESARAYREVHGKPGAIFALKKVAKKFEQLTPGRDRGLVKY